MADGGAVESPPRPSPSEGLSAAEAERRLAARGGPRRPPPGRSYASIVFANVFNVFNLVLGAFGALTFMFGSWQDALFLCIALANTTIGIAQEARAKRELDRLSALVVPTATVLRDGQSQRLPREQLVEGDLVVLSPGDQLIGDGVLESRENLLLDESILTGESENVPHAPGDELRSGSFVAEGTGRYTLTAVGETSYAERITGEARSFRHPRSPLERETLRLLYVLCLAMAPLAGLLGYALWERQEPIADAVATAVAAVVTLVPEGLILLVSLTFAAASIRMARRGALAQQLNAIESLASVDVMCLDKTGTLTEPRLHVTDAVPAEGARSDLESALASFAAATSTKNATVQAIADRFPGVARQPDAEVPFSSRWRWSGVQLEGTSYVLGAPELFQLGELAARAESEARSGRRVVAFARADGPLDARDPVDGPPVDPHPLGLVVLAELLRPNARSTVEYFQSQNVQLKVISGDRPETVAAIAADVGIPVAAGPVDGRALPDDDEALRSLLREHNVIGRISPEGKRRVVEALRDDGNYVGMIGDGVNDVPGLKASRLGIAQGSGVQMARSVADLVLVENDFSVVPKLVGEGRQILRNIQRVTKLYVSKSVVAAFLILVVGISPTSYPLLPRHLSLVAALAVGIPSFFLALAPSKGPYKLADRYLLNVTYFAIPAGTAIGLGVVASYLTALEVINLPLLEARTVATTVMLVVSLYLIVVLEAIGKRRGTAVTVVCFALLAAYVLILVLPLTREFFALAQPNLAIALTSAAGSLLATGGLVLSSSSFLPGGSEAELRRALAARDGGDDATV
jgi:P-type E1-E2 ATPase